MVAPITGPFQTSINVVRGGFSVYFWRQNKFKQLRPIDQALQYKLHVISASKGAGSNPGIGASGVNTETFVPGYSSLVDQAVTAAYEKFKAKAYDTAGLGVDLVELGQSIGMIANAAVRLRRSMTKVRHLDFAGAARELRMLTPKGVSTRKNWADNWLEYHFGWTPIFQDVHDTIKVFSEPIKNCKAFGVGSAEYEYTRTDILPPSSKQVYTAKGKIFAKVGAYVAVSNPNLHLADQLGLLNPASLVWEAIPFSFVADWFVNIGSVISSYSDFAGCTLQLPYTTVLDRIGSFTEMDYFGSSLTASMSSSGTIMTRTPGLTKPSLVVKPLRLPSISRALTEWALLVQFAERGR